MFFLLSYLFFEKKAEYTRTYILNEWINRRKTWSRRSRIHSSVREQVIRSITSFIDIVEYDGVEFGKIGAEISAEFGGETGAEISDDFSVEFSAEIGATKWL